MAKRKMDADLLKAGEILFNYFNQKYGKGGYGIQEILSEMINTFMLQERNAKLKLKDLEDVGNGFFPRNVNSSYGKLSLLIPRTRKNLFRSSILPEKYKRIDESYIDMMMSLLLSGNSKSMIKDILSMHGMTYSEEVIDEISNALFEKMESFKKQELQSSIAFLYIDGKIVKVKNPSNGGKVRLATLYTALAIDFKGRKNIIGYYWFYGKETKSRWMQIFQDLVVRGLKRVLLVISDNLIGIKDAVAKVFPNAFHQICLLHFLRNAKRHLPHSVHGYVVKLFKDLKNAYDVEEGKIIINKIFDILREYNSKEDMSRFETAKENYIAFLRFPEKVRKHIYTTNPVESVHSMYDKAVERVGGYFKSEKNMDLNIFITIDKLNDKWRKKPVPMIKSASYELVQMANFFFEEEIDTQNS